MGSRQQSHLSRKRADLVWPATIGANTFVDGPPADDVAHHAVESFLDDVLIPGLFQTGYQLVLDFADPVVTVLLVLSCVDGLLDLAACLAANRLNQFVGHDAMEPVLPLRLAYRFSHLLLRVDRVLDCFVSSTKCFYKDYLS